MYTSRVAVSWVILVLSFILLNCIRLIDGAKVAERIVGGEVITVDKRKYLVSVRVNYGLYCGGTLVSMEHVVTAEHCVFNIPASRITVVGGTSYLEKGGVRREAAKIFHSPNFAMASLDMDVAVIKLQRPMEGENIQFIGLCSKQLLVGRYIQIFGWGLLSEINTDLPNQMHTTRVKTLPKNMCKKQYENSLKLTRKMFCAWVPGKKDACSGDSGGPAVFNGELCGVVSSGVGCARAQFAGVYASVYAVRAFITNAINS